MQENAQVFALARDLVFGTNWRALLGRYSRESSYWKTLQLSLLPEVEGLESLLTLPKWGMTRDGALYERPTPEHPTNAPGGGAWPTPTVRDWHSQGGNMNPGASAVQLSTLIEKWPTPQRKLDQKWSMDLKDVATWTAPRSDSDTMCGGSGHKKMLQGTELETGRVKLNPDWVEALMGFPVGWTDPDSPPRPDRSTTGSHRALPNDPNTVPRD